jgi:hypothetical protein
MKGKAGIENVPKDFLEPVFVDLLHSFGFGR